MQDTCAQPVRNDHVCGISGLSLSRDSFGCIVDFHRIQTMHIVIEVVVPIILNSSDRAQRLRGKLVALAKQATFADSRSGIDHASLLLKFGNIGSPMSILRSSTATYSQ